MSLPYSEGTWFSVPLRNGNFAPGLVARATKKGKVILCYFFPSSRTMPELDELKNLTSKQAVLVARVGDLGLINNSWPILGKTKAWKREQWIMPVFARREPLSDRTWLVYRSDNDPSLIIREELASNLPVDSSIKNDSIYGYGAVEEILT